MDPSLSDFPSANGTPSSVATSDGRKKRKRVTRACDECKCELGWTKKVFVEVANEVLCLRSQKEGEM